MAKYRKRPLIVDAEQFFVDRKPWPAGVKSVEVQLKDTDPQQYVFEPIVETLEGPLMVSDGDWIITGVKGEKYPVKPDVFDATYEPLVETDG